MHYSWNTSGNNKDEPDTVLNATKEMISRNNNWRNPFGDGKAGERIV